VCGAANRGATEEHDVDDPAKLRELAAWYREFAEQSGNPTIWDGRLRTAENLEAEASLLETRSARSGIRRSPPRQNQNNDAASPRLTASSRSITSGST
jgi:hypothetical protein